MPALDQWDTGYRSPDWDERPDWARRLDYHDTTVDMMASELLKDVHYTCRAVEDPSHDFDHVRNVLALLIRQVGTFYRMSPEQMRSFACGLAYQAYREEHIRLFHCDNR